MTLKQICEQAIEFNNQATPGPWVCHRSTRDDGSWVIGIDMPNGKELPDYHFISTDPESGTHWHDGELIQHAKANYANMARACLVMMEALEDGLFKWSGPIEGCDHCDSNSEITLAMTEAVEKAEKIVGEV